MLYVWIISRIKVERALLQRLGSAITHRKRYRRLIFQSDTSDCFHERPSLLALFTRPRVSALQPAVTGQQQRTPGAWRTQHPVLFSCLCGTLFFPVCGL